MSDKKNVVIIKDTKGNTCYVAYISCLDKNEINKAINESVKYQQTKDEEIKEIKTDLLLSVKEINKLELEIKLDRGEITKEEYDNEFKLNEEACEELLKEIGEYKHGK